MSLLKQVTKSAATKKPLRILVHGLDGIGKTSFAASAPNPIFILSENGLGDLEVNHFPLMTKFDQLQQSIKELIEQPHDFKTVVIDCIDGFESMLFKDICQQHSVKNIELAMGGYGKGYIEATRIFSTVKDSLEVLRDKRNMNIVLLAHSQITNFTEPATQFAYQRYEVKMQKGSSALFREYVDTVLFFNLELFTKTEGQNTRTFSDGARIMYTERRPGWDAKNRFGLPLKLDLSWDSLIQSIEKAKPMSLEAVTEKIDGLMSFIHDEELKTKVIDTVIAAKGDVLRLQAIANRLEIRVSES